MTEASNLQLIVGLGNPGEKYAKTRHNAGSWFLRSLAQHYEVTLKPEAKFFGSVGRLVGSFGCCWLLEPSVFMNESGRAVKSFVHFYKIPPSAVLIAHDELDFTVGTVRIKIGGGHGGHNGLRDIISQLKSSSFLRLRIGIGHPGVKSLVTSYVLETPSRVDEEKIRESIDRALVSIPALLTGELEKAFRLLHAAP